MILSHFLLNLSLLQGRMLRFIIAAVSPAVVVPEMFKLKEKNSERETRYLRQFLPPLL